jgi:hypothetical protein
MGERAARSLDAMTGWRFAWLMAMAMATGALIVRWHLH